MLQWTQMSAEQRTIARENYEMSRALAPSARQQAWRAYQALPPAQKQKLAEAERTHRRALVVSAPPGGREAPRRHATGTVGAKPGAGDHRTDGRPTAGQSGQPGQPSAGVSAGVGLRRDTTAIVGAGAQAAKPTAPATAEPAPVGKPPAAAGTEARTRTTDSTTDAVGDAKP